MYSKPLDQSTCRRLPGRAREVWEMRIKCLDLVVQPGSEQIYCRCSPQTEEEGGYPGVERPFCGAFQTLSSQNLILR